MEGSGGGQREERRETGRQRDREAAIERRRNRETGTMGGERNDHILSITVFISNSNVVSTFLEGAQEPEEDAETDGMRVQVLISMIQ